MRYCSVTGLYSELGVICSPKDTVCFFDEDNNGDCDQLTIDTPGLMFDK